MSVIRFFKALVMGLIDALVGVIKFFKGMLVGGDDLASMAKTSFCILFALAVNCWHRGIDIQPGHKEMMMALLIYVLGGKVVGGVGQFARRGGENEQS